MADLKVYARNLEQEAVEQIETLAAQPAFKEATIRIMPDAHAGAGCVIGFTADLGEKIVPNLVGVDIGCGMLTVEVEIPDDLAGFDECVKREVPAGFSAHERDTCDVTQLGLLCEDELTKVDRLNRSMGTLGGGNHFVELDVSGDKAYLVIHSGSRNLGLQVANIYQRKALEECADDVPKDLKYLTGELAEAYLHDMRICQRWARDNRDAMARAILDSYGMGGVRASFHTVHNYIADDNIIRKGAISARAGERVLIPFNMRDGAAICIGKGNEDWNYSAPHGAGRAMSRQKARELLDFGDFQAQMEGVYTTTATAETIDEAPGAYKPAQEIVELLEPTVKIVERITPVYNFKASDKTPWRS